MILFFIFGGKGNDLKGYDISGVVYSIPLNLKVK